MSNFMRSGWARRATTPQAQHAKVCRMPDKFHKLLFGSIWITLPLCLNPVAAQAESRGYVIGWLATASYYTGDVKMGCPDGRNGGVVEMHARELEAIGFGKKEAVELQRKQRDTD